MQILGFTYKVVSLKYNFSTSWFLEKIKKKKKEKGRSRYWDVNYLHESCLFFKKKQNYFKILILAKYSIFIKVVTLRKKLLYPLIIDLF